MFRSITAAEWPLDLTSTRGHSQLSYKQELEAADDAPMSARFETPNASVIVKHLCESADINRLLTAAAINGRFCRQLLENPKAAIAQGYGNEQFTFTAPELELLDAIRASSLAEFAAALHEATAI